MLGVALAFSVHLINASALAEFGAAVRAVNGEADLALVGPRGGFDEALYGRVAAAPGVVVASPVVEARDLRLRRAPARACRSASSASMRSSSRTSRRRCCRARARASERFSVLDPDASSSTPPPSDASVGAATDASRCRPAAGRRTLRIAGTVAAARAAARGRRHRRRAGRARQRRAG